MAYETQLEIRLMEQGQSGVLLFNEWMRWLGATGNLAVDGLVTVPTGAETEGTRYLIVATATGVFASHEGKIALLIGTTWYTKMPKEGWTCWVNGFNKYLVFDGSAWIDANSPRLQSVVDAATITPNADTDDMVRITAIAQAFTIANPTPITTRYEGQRLLIRIKDNGTGRAITWGSEYRALGTALPATTVATKTLLLTFQFNSTDTKWDLIHAAAEV